ncbi:MAG: 16S rRNA (uracil(1498)-N(3))-methyltransferase [Pedosphaera sp.]|nr:16S rRNA (uracil(1498)-N(3))-methyltransferase [Pedosphaera sp.]
MHRFFLPPEACQQKTITLGNDQSRHAARVLRVNPGESIEILDGAGALLQCIVSRVTKSAVSARILRRQQLPASTTAISLLQALVKSKAWDTILQKATELGTHQIVPLATARSVRVLAPADTASKMSGWRTTTIEAAKQCGTPWLPAIEMAVTPEEWLQKNSTHGRPELVLLCSLESNARHIGTAFTDFLRQHQRQPKTIAIAIGPEGDFSPEELQQFRSAGAIPITLGKLVLRADTAAIAAIAVIQHELTRI